MKKILLIRFSSIGDIVLTTPVVRAIKQQTKATLHCLTKKSYEGLYKNNPYVDQVYSFQDDEKEVISLLKKENYDFVVDLQKNIRSWNVRKALKAPSATFPKKNLEKWILVNLKINLLPPVHIVDRYFEAVKPLQVHNDGKGLDYFIPAINEIAPSSIDPVLKNGYIAFVLGGQHQTKIFPPEKVAEVINRLEMPVVLLGGKEDQARGKKVVELTPDKKVIDLCGRVGLNTSASMVKQCRVLVTNDTGLMHIGAAFKKPIVSIWGNTVPAFGMYPYLPSGKGKYFIAEVKDLRCRPCSKLGKKRCPKKHFNCMMKQDIPTIVNKIKTFFEEK